MGRPVESSGFIDGRRCRSSGALREQDQRDEADEEDDAPRRFILFVVRYQDQLPFSVSPFGHWLCLSVQPPSELMTG